MYQKNFSCLDPSNVHWTVLCVQGSPRYYNQELFLWRKENAPGSYPMLKGVGLSNEDEVG